MFCNGRHSQDEAFGYWRWNFEIWSNLQVFIILQVFVADPFENPIIKELYAEWLDQPGSEKSKRLMHTEYHPVVRSITSELQNWWWADGSAKPSGMQLSVLSIAWWWFRMPLPPTAYYDSSIIIVGAFLVSLSWFFVYSEFIISSWSVDKIFEEFNFGRGWNRWFLHHSSYVYTHVVYYCVFFFFFM